MSLFSKWSFYWSFMDVLLVVLLVHFLKETPLVFPIRNQEQNPGGYIRPKPALRMATRSVVAASVSRPNFPDIVEDVQGEVHRICLMYK